MFMQILNPLDGICNVKRKDAICVNHLRGANKHNADVLQERPDVKIFLPFRFFFYTPESLFIPDKYQPFLVAPMGDHVLSLVDEISYTMPPAPALSQLYDIPEGVFCNGDNRPLNCAQNCQCTHSIDIPLNAIVEVIVIDEVQQLNLSHPFHLHGQVFQLIGLGRSPIADVKKITLKHALDLDRKGLLNRHFDSPPSKDTIAIPNNGYAIFRFKAVNPGFWLFHCHFLFHTVTGMAALLHVGTPADLPPVPHDFPKCGSFLPDIEEPYPIYRVN